MRARCPSSASRQIYCLKYDPLFLSSDDPQWETWLVSVAEQLPLFHTAPENSDLESAPRGDKVLASVPSSRFSLPRWENMLSIGAINFSQHRRAGSRGKHAGTQST